MPPNQINFRPSEAVPPRPKRRKVGYLVTDGPRSAGSSQIPQAARRELSQYDEDAFDENGRTASVNANVPRESTTGLAYRIPTTPIRTQLMLAKTSPVTVHRVRPTPARPQTRIVPKDIGDPNLANPRLSFMKEHSSPPVLISQKRIGRVAEGRLQKNIKPRSKEARSIERRGFVNSNDNTDGTDSPDSPDEISSEIFRRKPRRISQAVRLPPRGHRAARKTKIQVAAKSEQRTEHGRGTSQLYRFPSAGLILSRNQVTVDDDDVNDDLHVNENLRETLNPVQQLHDSDADSSSANESSEEESRDLKQDMLDSLRIMTIRETRLFLGSRLPFMRRNVRRVMESFGTQQRRKQNLGDFQQEIAPKVSVSFIFEGVEFKRGEFDGSWICPICNTNMYFGLREGLSLHLSWYHSQCEFEWEEAKNSTPILSITIPDDPVSDSDSEEDIDDDWSESSESDFEMPMDELNFTRRSPTPEVKPFLCGSSVVMVQNASSTSPIKVQPVSPTLSPIQSPKEPERKEVPRPPRPIHPEDPLRYPTPPPYSNLEGPSAVYPYISGGHYSDRIGGPYLYDILNELPLEPYGNMTWQLLEKEGEIFEQDNVRDEDKVMRALWSRWIRLNKNKFNADYKNGVLMFIDEYWRYIHRAAGFAALRTLLLTFVDYRFLDGEQLCTVMRYYRDLVGMDQW